MNVDSNLPHPRGSSFIKGMLIEGLIILILTGVVIAVLNFFNIIDLKALFVSQVNNVTLKNTPGNIPVQQNVILSNKNESVSLTHPDYAQPNISVASKNKALHYSQILSEFEGKILDISTKPGLDPDTKASYSAKLIVGVGVDKITLFYPQQALDKITVQDATKKNMSMGDLKVGDAITVKTNTGILRNYPNNINAILITKK